jgi:formate dehydrogenase subunit delta
MSGSEHLVHMANDIGNFFRANPDRNAAIVSISNHIKSFWTPRMRRKLISDMHGDDEELDELPREALRLLKEHPDFKPKQLPEGGPEGGGDAG